MVSITLGSLTVQDPSWGGAGASPVPTRPRVEVQPVRNQDAWEERHDMLPERPPVLSLSLFGLVEISVMKKTP